MRPMLPVARQYFTLDRLGIALSTLCLVHCVATVAAVALLASAGGALGADWLHEAGLGVAVILGAFALGRGISEHGYMLPSAIGGLGLGVMGGALALPHGASEIFATMLGVAILGLGHRLNAMARD